MVSGDTNGSTDVFVRDITSGTTKLVSAAADGTIGNGGSCGFAMTPDARYVAFSTQATNLVPGGDTNGDSDVLRKDLVTGSITRVSVATDGTQGNGGSGAYGISADGRYVVFESSSTNFPPGSTYHNAQVYVRDLQAGTTTEVSVTPQGAPGNQLGAGSAAISSDGRYIAFGSESTDLVAGDTNGVQDVFVRDMTTGTTTRASVDSNGNQLADGGDLESISPDGRYVLFVTLPRHPLATQIVIERTWLHDMQTGATTQIGVSSSGAIANSDTTGARMSSDDRYVTFSSFASNLVACDTNRNWDGFIRDLQTGTTTRVTLTATGGQMNAGGGVDARTPDGRFLLLDSWSSNMVPSDTNNVGDLFRRDTTPGTTPAAPLMGITGPANRANSTAVPITGCASSGLTIHLTVRDATHRAVVTLLASRGAWSTKLNLSHFADGKLSVMAYATNSTGATSARTYATLVKDTVSPTAQITAPTTRYIPRTVTVRWSGADNKGGSGIASYDVRWRYGRSRLSAYAIVEPSTKRGYATFTLAATTTYCWSVRARDAAGNLSAWSADRCATTQ